MHSSFSPDSDVKPEKLARRCEAMGLGLIAVTDHNTIDGALAVRELSNIPVIVGEEIGSSHGEIIGLFLEDTIPGGLDSVETALRIKTQGGLVCIPHPFDRFRRNVISYEALEKLVPYVDAIETFNSRNNLARDDEKAFLFASKYGIPGLGVTDSHTTIEVGRTYMELPEFDLTARGLREAIKDGNIVGRRMTPIIHAVTTLTKVKKLLQKRMTKKLNVTNRTGPPR